jgi:NADPH2 dehydrogenase
MEYPKMRRAEKSLTETQARKIIESAPYGVLSLCGSLPYGVPLSAALDGDTIYFHCANEGFKLDLIKEGPKGHFTFVSNAKILSEKATVAYRSAMAYGDLRIVTSPAERKKAYAAIVDKYMKKYPEQAKKAIQKSDAKTTLVAMDIRGLSAKSNSEKAKKDKSKISLSSPITIKGHEVKNRIVMPPLVRLIQEREKGALTPDDYNHYALRAKNGTGLIVVEATAVDKNGLTFKSGLRLWDDKHIEQFKKLTEEVKKYGAVILIQLQHGGYKSMKDSTDPLSASGYDDGKNKARAMTEKEADDTVERFAQAALRAHKAGFDGVELHGCHGFLINQFSCPAINKRTDKYAKSSAFGTAVIRRIKELCNDDFIISVRAGIDSPSVNNSIKTALDYQNAGADMLSVSAGINTKPFCAPDDWKHSDIAYLAYLVKQNVQVPVAGVYGITDGKEANSLVKNKYMDMAAVGRGHLIHPDWAKRALSKEDISKCRLCKKDCYFFGTLKKCPAVESAKKKGYI